ncbi:MAG: hypothetical protein AB8B51_15130 [Sedimentitalea sp.]
MLDVLAKVFGPHHGVTVYAFLQKWGIGIAFGVVFAAGLVMLLTLSSPERFEHVSYDTMPVVRTSPLNNDPNIGLIFDIELPDGNLHRLTETEGPITASISDTACVETRRYIDSGALAYRLRLPHRCAG